MSERFSRDREQRADDRSGVSRFAVLVNGSVPHNVTSTSEGAHFDAETTMNADLKRFNSVTKWVSSAQLQMVQLRNAVAGNLKNILTVCSGFDQPF
jgi:hypothetical protein